MAIQPGSAPTKRLAGQAVADEPHGFLGRWSRRKVEVLKGRPLEEPVVVKPPVSAEVLGGDVLGPGLAGATGGVARAPDASANRLQPLLPNDASSPSTEVPVPSLEDAAALTSNSDFKPFMARNVGAAVRNAAMNKLFSDPQFNVMDGLDIYIDDYSIADPIPESMLRQMNGAKFLDLFADEEVAEKALVAGDAARESANNHTTESMAQSPHSDGENHSATSPDHSGLTESDIHSQPEPASDLPGSGASQHNHANTDLRLQPDHAATASDAGSRT